MRSLTWSEWGSYPLVVLVPSLRKSEIQKEYLDAFGIPTDDVKVLSLHFEGKKTPVAEMKRFLNEELVPELNSDSGLKYLIVADAGYYKVLTGQGSAEANLGYVQDCLFGPWKVVYVPNVRTIFYDPEKVRAKIAQSLNALLTHIQGQYQAPGDGIIHFEAYPKTEQEISDWLEKLLAMDRDLTIDIEAFSLKHHKAGIGTICFAWSKHEGIAFPVDYKPIEGAVEAPFGQQVYNAPLRKLLSSFFKRFLKKAIYHNISYDVYNLIYQLFMTNLLDTEGILEGMEIMLRNWDDTQLITYLATNSCSGNKLGLKDNSQEFSGNYAVDVEDITTVPLEKLLRYNLIDGLSTWFVNEKYWDKMVADQQFEIYTQLFKPSIADIIQMQLTGLPLNIERVKEVKAILQKNEADALSRFRATKVVQQFTYRLKEQHVAKRNSELKKKRISMADQEVQEIEFNPNSGPQLQDLLYDMLGLPIIDLTDNKNPATGGDTLKKLKNHTNDPDVQVFLDAMQDYADVNIILTTFIPAFEDAALGPDGWYYLIGSFRLGGTLSGRLSSRNPNLQNIPANSRYAKLIKSCFQAPPGWVFCGLDFRSLEDMISALTTKDPNKIKVYTDGYDGHSLRAYAYFKDQMLGIVDTVDSINSIQTKYKKLRQDSKPPTFALTYQGTYITLVKNCGFSEQEAKQIEARYHELYQISDAWVQDKLNQAGKDGYITAAFGLRIRTPLLQQVIRGTSKTPFEAEAEGRTAGNALGQSWCLLTNRASVEFMTKVRISEHRLDIRPCAHIHDAQYMIVREDVATLLYANEHLVKAVQWQEHPEIQHDEVKLGGVFSIFWPDWSHEIDIPNSADEAGLHAALSKKLEKA
jgi:DNA polymerase I